MKLRLASQSEIFASECRAPGFSGLCDLLVNMSLVVDSVPVANEIQRVARRVVSAKGGRPVFSIETSVRILGLKRLHNFSGERVGFQLLDWVCVQRFCGLTTAANIPFTLERWTLKAALARTA